MVRRKLVRSKEDKPAEPYQPKKFKEFGNRFCIKCGHFRPLGFGRKCPWCFVQDGDDKDHTEEDKYSEETKKVLLARRERRKKEASIEQTVAEKVKKLLSLDRKGVQRETYTARGRRGLRAKQAMFLTEQLDMVLSLFEPDYEGGYLVYRDKLAEMTPQIRALKKEIVRFKKTFARKETAYEKKTDYGQNRRPEPDFDIFGPFT